MKDRRWLDPGAGAVGIVHAPSAPLPEGPTACTELGLTMGAGVYGATFFMLTGFHGFHVTLGAIMLAVVAGRCLSGHFDAKRHFAFEAGAWYWHFVDVVWLLLFVVVYWL